MARVNRGVFRYIRDVYKDKALIAYYEASHIAEQARLQKLLSKQTHVSGESSLEDLGRGSELSFGFRTWMPAVTIHGNDYSLAYESITEDHIKGIPVRRDDRVIGYIESLKDGLATFHLNDGETLELSPAPSISISVGSVGFIGETLEGAMLESLGGTVDRALRPIIPLVKEMAQGGYYEGVKK